MGDRNWLAKTDNDRLRFCIVKNEGVHFMSFYGQVIAILQTREILHFRNARRIRETWLMFTDTGIKLFENKVWLSSPTMHGDELRYMTETFDTNWMSTIGKNIDEVEMLKKNGKKLDVESYIFQRGLCFPSDIKNNKYRKEQGNRDYQELF